MAAATAEAPPPDVTDEEAMQRWLNKRHMKLTLEQATARVARCLPGVACTAIRRLPERMGFNNPVYILTTSDGTPLVLRLMRLFPEVAPWKVSCEAAVLAFVGRHLPRVPVPRVHGFEDMDAELGCGWMIQTLVPGVPWTEMWPTAQAPARTRLLQQLADAVGELNSISFRHGGSLVFASAATPGCVRVPCAWQAADGTEHCDPDFVLIGMNENYLDPSNRPAESWFDLLRILLTEQAKAMHGDASWGPLSEPLQDFAQNVLSGVCGSPPFVLAHCDLQDRNILVDPATATITGILDWEWSGALPFEHEGGFTDLGLTPEELAELGALLLARGLTLVPSEALVRLRAVRDLSLAGANVDRWIGSRRARSPYAAEIAADTLELKNQLEWFRKANQLK